MSTDDFALPAHEFQAISALHWISRFGWLRARELGALLYPLSGTIPGTLIADVRRMNEQRKLASRLLSRLRESRYVLQRSLPGKAGDAYVISGAIESKVNDGTSRIYKAGESWSEPPGASHPVSRNASKTRPAKLLAVFVADTGDEQLTTYLK